MLHEAPRTPRARRRDASAQRILDEAMALVARDGLDGLSMARLAEAADYTPGALYRYFDSKDALLSRLVERTLGDVRGALAGALQTLPSGGTPLARVIALSHAYRRFAQREPHRFGLLAMTLASPRVLLPEAGHAAPAATAMVAAMQPLGTALAAAADAGALAPGAAFDRAMVLFATLQSVLQLGKLGRMVPDLLDVERLAGEGIRALLLGWGATATRLDAALAEVAARAPAATTGDLA
jgi:AcrR family transcriptional regulator